MLLPPASVHVSAHVWKLLASRRASTAMPPVGRSCAEGGMNGARPLNMFADRRVRWGLPRSANSPRLILKRNYPSAGTTLGPIHMRDPIWERALMPRYSPVEPAV